MKKISIISLLFVVVCIIRIQSPTTVNSVVSNVVYTVAWKAEDIILWQEWRTRHADAMEFNEYRKIKGVF